MTETMANATMFDGGVSMKMRKNRVFALVLAVFLALALLPAAALAAPAAETVDLSADVNTSSPWMLQIVV
jgi:hypothetical protein